MSSEFDNILVIHFGQLGDVLMGLPAMKAIRDRFPDSSLTAVVGSATAEVVKLAGMFDEVIDVDRVRLLKASKFHSSIEIIRFALSIRRRRFDFVIDLHSLPETNLLGFFSGARHRLFSKRESRSLDFLAKFDPPPPAEDKSKHLSEYYLNVLSPLGVSKQVEPFVFERPDKVAPPEKPVIGLNPGAGHASRRWPLENFVNLAKMIVDSNRADVAVFLGPEESSLAANIGTLFAVECSIVSGLSLSDLAGRFADLSCLVSNDTGPIHIATASGTPIVLLLQNASPDRYLPLTRAVSIHRGERLEDIPVEAVFGSVIEMLEASPAR